ncbi:MAG TPA: Asp23/Gls24 family envelope stress response protein [Ktedonobacterales bacterium]|jgi:uncharacterized alkaline shock family protein YloU
MERGQTSTLAASFFPWGQAEADLDAPAEGQPGRVRIARRALRTVVREAALSIPGVVRLRERASGWTAYLGRPLPREGIALVTRGGQLGVDLYLVVAPGMNLLTLGEAVQEAVGAAIEQIVGIAVSAINVYIQDVA